MVHAVERTALIPSVRHTTLISFLRPSVKRDENIPTWNTLDPLRVAASHPFKSGLAVQTPDLLSCSVLIQYT